MSTPTPPTPACDWFNNFNHAIQQKLSAYMPMEDIQIVVEEARKRFDAESASLRERLATAEAEAEELRERAGASANYSLRLTNAIAHVNQAEGEARGEVASLLERLAQCQDAATHEPGEPINDAYADDPVVAAVFTVNARATAALADAAALRERLSLTGESHRRCVAELSVMHTDAAALRDEVAHYRGLANEAANDALTTRERVTPTEECRGECERGKCATCWPASEPVKPPVTCMCTHAPEQHDSSGCGVVSIMSGRCPCEWNGARTPAARTAPTPCKHPSTHAEATPLGLYCRECGEVVGP